MKDEKVEDDQPQPQAGKKQRKSRTQATKKQSGPLPKIVTEDYDWKQAASRVSGDYSKSISSSSSRSNHNLKMESEESDLASPLSPTGAMSGPERVRMRSHSGPGQASGSLNHGKVSTLPPGSRLDPVASHRTRRQSGDDILFSPKVNRATTATASLFESFRPRSKSDSKGKRPNFISQLRNSVHMPWTGGEKKSTPTSCPVSRNQLDPHTLGADRPRSRSGSGESGGRHGSRVMDMFRNRSHSVAVIGELRGASKKFGGAGTQSTDNENLVYVKFFKFYRCYDLIPISAKLVVFDTQLLVKKAFYALVSNGIRAAPLWDSAKQGFVGMLTITDFINILRTYYKSSAAKMDELEEQKLEAWRNVLKDNSRPIITIEPEANLLDAIKALIHNRVHRLPVIDSDTGNVVYVLTYKRILKFLSAYFNDLPTPRCVHSTIKELNIGTYENIAVTTMETPLIEALHVFCERRVSALPVCDGKGRVIDIYAKFDVINLAAEKIYSNLDITVKKALEHREHYFEGVITCKASDTLLVVLDKIFKNEVHRLVIVDDKDVVIGIVSLSDILSFLALKPLAMERQEKSNTLVENSVEEAAEEQGEKERTEDESMKTAQSE